MINAVLDLFSTKPDLPVVPASLFYQKDGYKVGSIDISLILSEDHALTSSVTTHPVEDGSVVSDHIRNELRVGSLRALVTNHSIYYAKNDEDVEVEQVIEAGKSAVVSNAALEAWKKFKALWAARELVTIVTSLETYSDVAVVSVSTMRDGATGESLEFDITFQQVRKVKLTATEFSAAVQSDTSTEIGKKSSVKLQGGQKVGQGNFQMNAVLVKLGA